MVQPGRRQFGIGSVGARDGDTVGTTGHSHTGQPSLGDKLGDLSGAMTGEVYVHSKVKSAVSVQSQYRKILQVIITTYSRVIYRFDCWILGGHKRI